METETYAVQGLGSFRWRYWWRPRLLAETVTSSGRRCYGCFEAVDREIRFRSYLGVRPKSTR